AVFGCDLLLPHRPGEAREVALDEVIHGDHRHRLFGQLVEPPMPPGAEEGPLLEPSLLDVFAYGFARVEVEPDTAMLVSLLVEGDGRLVSVLVEVLHLETARGPDPDPRVEEELEDRPVPEVKDRVAGWEPHQLPGPSCREGLRLIPRVGRSSRDEL